ncbi:MAG: hypothetical protein LBQ21_04500 [Clostridiales Family XIII bacterium]|jgi:hypothetical protein|nr:hypothetical protein [Clostridiales Family XIII bacterium]
MTKQTNFKSMDSLDPIIKVVNEAEDALNNKARVIADSAIPEVLAGAAGAVAGGAISFVALINFGSVVGLSAAGITSGLAAAGGIVGGGMVAGIAVLAAPVAILGAGAVGITAAVKHKKLIQKKEALLKAAVAKYYAIVRELKNEVGMTKERAEYLNALNVLLQAAIRDLKADLGKAA